MDFLSIRKKARERAEARARQAEGPAVPPPAAAPRPPAAPGPLQEDLRAELSRLDAERGRLEQPPSPSPSPPLAGLGAPAPLLDPLDEFFWREDETAPGLPDLGLGAAGRPAAEPPAEPPREFVAFLLGGEEYAVAIDRVREVLKPPPITEVPGAPAQVLGVITLRGEVVTVADPRWALALPPAPASPRARLVVCQTAEGMVALRVDAVSQVVRLPAAAIEPRPPGITGAGTAPLIGIGREGDRLVILLDLDTLVGGAPAPQGIP